jgi:hypothetical protein
MVTEVAGYASEYFFAYLRFKFVATARKNFTMTPTTDES